MNKSKKKTQKVISKQYKITGDSLDNKNFVEHPTCLFDVKSKKRGGLKDFGSGTLFHIYFVLHFNHSSTIRHSEKVFGKRTTFSPVLHGGLPVLRGLPVKVLSGTVPSTKLSEGILHTLGRVVGRPFRERKQILNLKSRSPSGLEVVGLVSQHEKGPQKVVIESISIEVPMSLCSKA